VENLLLAQDFTSLQTENEKAVSGLLPVQFVSLQLVCIVVLQHKSERMGFLKELTSRLTGRNEVTMQLCNSSLHIHGQRREVLNYC